MRAAPLISIITVVKNDLAGLAATRASLRAQHFQGFDWLVADGGSSDGSAQALAGWSEEIAWSRSGHDAGPFDAMNRAMTVATGDYLLFLNAGDRLASPDSLTRIAPLLQARRPDLAYGHALEDPGDGSLRLKPCRHRRWAWYGMIAHHCALFYRRALVADLRYPTDLVIAADQAFTLAALSRARLVQRLDLPVAIFAAGGLSRRHPSLGRREQDHLRRAQLGIPAPVSLGIRLVQVAAGTVREVAPTIYALLRFRTKHPLPEKSRSQCKPNDAHNR